MPPTPSPSVPYPPGYGYYPRPTFDYSKQVDRTRTGLLLLVAGTFLSLVPIINFLGGILVLIGALLVILGRRAFGRQHARNVMASLGLFVLGFVAIFALVVAVFLRVLSRVPVNGAPPSTEVLSGALASAFSEALPGFIIIVAIFGFMVLLFTYALQDRLGKTLLWGSFVGRIAVSSASLFLLAPHIGDFVQPVGTPVTSLTFNVSSDYLALLLLGLIPTVLSGAAYYLAWSRVNRGEIPARPTSPPGGMWSPPAGPG